MKVNFVADRKDREFSRDSSVVPVFGDARFKEEKEVMPLVTEMD